MKKLISVCLILFTLSFSAIALADVVEVGVPITVQGDTYTVVNTPDYYYYEGHRCYVKERTDVAGVTILGIHAGVGGGSKIYCYPYP